VRRIAGSRRKADVACVAALLVVGLASSVPAWRGAPSWTVDGFFYQAQTLEARGASQARALHEVFDGPLTAQRRASEVATLPPRQRRLDNPAWVRYSAGFYRRRWVQPLLAAAVYPLLGSRSLADVALVGYLLSGVALFALLRARFRPLPSAIGAALFVLVPQYRSVGLAPLTDAWGIALEALSLLAALRYLETRRRILLVLWLVATATLAFTRDLAPVVVLAAAAVALLGRSPRALALAATALVLGLLPGLLFGVHFQRLLAFTLADFRIPPSTSWTWSVHHYPAAADGMLHSFVTPVRHGLPPVTLVALLLGLVAAAAALRRRDPASQLLLGAAVGAVLLVLSLPQPGFRIALALAPVVAYGYAALVTRALSIPSSLG
jgi:hypothetical protein